MQQEGSAIIAIIRVEEMNKYNFLYRDQTVSQNTIDSYVVGNYLHEGNPVDASFLRGGLLTGCNMRYLFTTEIGKTLIWADIDYRKQGLYSFDIDLYYEILDVYKVGSYHQVLLSPDGIEGDLEKAVIAAARNDFTQLLNMPPVAVLDTVEWRSRLAKPIGYAGKNRPHISS